jgi:hypothetical protein
MAFESLLFSQFEETTGTFSVFLFCSSNKPFVPDTSDTIIIPKRDKKTPAFVMKADVSFCANLIITAVNLLILKRNDQIDG